MEEILILVNKKYNSIGSERKLLVHQQGLLHRAFSIFIFDSKDRLLLQQRAHREYHSAGQWNDPMNILSYSQHKTTSLC